MTARGRDATRRARRASAAAPSATLLGLSALHVAWGMGSACPAGDRHALADAVAGTQEVPSAAACFAVAGALAIAAVTVGAPADGRVLRVARGAIAAGFATRGLLGITGTTRWLVAWTPSARFTRLDRRRYGPGCLALAAAVAVAARPS